MFSPTEELFCFKIWVVFGEATSQLICFFLNLCHRGYSLQKTLIQISSLRPATTPRVWDSGTLVKFPPGRRKNKTKQEQNGDREQALNSEHTEVK